jgi:hypothetical protein
MKRSASLVLALLLGAAALAGCSRPQVEPDNLHLIASLRTALSARNTQWLQQNAELINERHRQGKLSDKAHREFVAIIEKAEHGNWQEAEEDTLAFQRAQRPSDDQVQRVQRYWQ